MLINEERLKDKAKLVKVLFTLMAIGLLVLLILTFLLFYVFGPLNPQGRRPKYLIDIFLYKEYIMAGLLFLSLTASVILSFKAASRPSAQSVRLAMRSYLFIPVFFLLQVIWLVMVVKGPVTAKPGAAKTGKVMIQKNVSGQRR